MLQIPGDIKMQMGTELLYRIEKYFEINKKEILEKCYLILFGIFFVDAFLHTTMFPLKDHSQFHIMLRIVMLVFIFAKIAISQIYRVSEVFVISIVMLSFFVAYARRSRYEILLTFVLLLIGAQGLSFRKIVQVYFGLGAILMVLMIVAAETGLIENLIYHQEGRRARIAFGSVYPTDFSAHVFYLCLAWTYIRKERLRIRELIIFLACGSAIYVFCDARMNTAMIVLLTLMLLYQKIQMHFEVKKGKIWRRSRLLQGLMVGAVPLCAGFITLLTLSYREDSEFWKIVNWLTSSRLLLGKKGITEYGFSWFGQYIPMIGSGGSTETRANYFFLDSSYISILLCMGTVVFCVICFLSVKISYRALKEEDFVFLTVLFCMALQCTVEHHMLEIAYNPFLLSAFTKSMQNGDDINIKKGRSK